MKGRRFEILPTPELPGVVVWAVCALVEAVAVECGQMARLGSHRARLRPMACVSTFAEYC